MSQLSINSNYILDGLYTCSITIHKISKGLFPPCTPFPIIEDDDPLYFAEYVDKYIVNNYEPDYTPIIFPIYHIITEGELKSFWLSQHAYYNNQLFDFNCVAVYLDGDEEEACKAWYGGKGIYTILTDEIICQKERLKTIYNDTVINVKFIVKCDYVEPFTPYNFEINDTIDCVPKYLSELFKLDNEVLQYYKNVKKYNQNLNYTRNEKRKLYITVIFTETNDTNEITYETIIIP